MILLEDILEKLEPLFRKLSSQPLKNFEGGKSIHLHLSPSEKEELYGDIMVKCIEYYREYDSTKGTPLEPYLIHKLRWFAHHQGEKMVEERKTMVYLPEIENLSGDDVFKQIEEEFDTGDDVSFELLQAIQELSPRQKEIFTLNAIEGYSIKDLSEQLRLDKAVVYRHRRLARRNLRKKIKNLP